MSIMRIIRTIDFPVPPVLGVTVVRMRLKRRDREIERDRRVIA